MKYRIGEYEVETFETFGGAWHAALSQIGAQFCYDCNRNGSIFNGHGSNERLALADLIRQLQTLTKEIDSL